MKIKIYNLINTLSKNTKIFLIIIFDLSLICMTFSFSYFLYLNELYSFNLRNIFYILLLSIFSIPIFNFFGLYKSLIQYIEIEVVFDIFKAVTIYLIFVSLIVFFLNFENISKRVLFINYLIILISIIYSRLIAKKIIYGYLYQDILSTTEELSQFNLETTTESDVLSALGSPSIKISDINNIWIYLVSLKEQKIFENDEVIFQSVIRFEFNKSGSLISKNFIDEEDFTEIAFSNDKTRVITNNYGITDQIYESFIRGQ